jgi:hypothetical protein
MAEKSKGPKKKPAKRTVRATNNAKPSAAKTVYYVSASASSVSISNHKPADVKSVKQFAAFETAKNAAIDALIASIEHAEEQLHAIKRAASYEQLPK